LRAKPGTFMLENIPYYLIVIKNTSMLTARSQPGGREESCCPRSFPAPT
jgi:hypothetical protein